MTDWLAGLNVPDVGFIVALALTSLVAAFVALYGLVALAPDRRRERRALISGVDADVAYLFEDETLVDASAQARQLLEAAPGGGTAWSRLMMLLLPRFPEVEHRVGALARDERQEFVSIEETTRLIAEWRGGLVRLTLIDTESEVGGAGIDRHGLRAMEHELETLRQVTEHTPSLMWKQSARGQITWANRAFLDMIGRVRSGADSGAWPPPALFEPVELMRSVEGGGIRRLSLTPEGSSRQLWYDCTGQKMGDEVLFVAVDVNAAVRAEGQLREFMGTLTKTFSHLMIGLAIFDRSRHLALFNPALTDLTQLPVDFLAGRPTLFGFLDRLREKKMIPEPKDYKGWRKKLLELEAAAEHGTYAETWSLPSGQTYRVTGRPHPDGAVAFLFENISAEISLTRQFRSELEMGQAVLDSLDEAIAVFSSDGILTMSNRAYSTLWGVDPGTSLRDISVTDAMRTWLSGTSPTPVWGDIRDFTARVQDRTEWTAEVRLNNGRGLRCRVAPLAGGATLVGFALPQTQVQSAEPGEPSEGVVRPLRA